MFGGIGSSFDHSSTNEESTSGQSRQMGATQEELTPQSRIQKIVFCCFPSGFDLNPTRIVLGEILGTFILIFSICGIEGSMKLIGSQVGLSEYATTAGSAIVVIAFTLGPISGAHVNPAVTFAFAVFGHFPWSKVPYYVMAQLVGSILATYLGEVVYGVKPEMMLTNPVKPTGVSGAFWAEFIATFIVTFLAASLAKDAKSVGHLAGFVMGIGITLAVLVTGPVSGGSLNPARSIGPAILSWKFDNLWIYLIAPVAGATLGVLMVHVLCLQRPLHNINSTPTTNSLA